MAKFDVLAIDSHWHIDESDVKEDIDGEKKEGKDGHSPYPIVGEEGREVSDERGEGVGGGGGRREEKKKKYMLMANKEKSDEGEAQMVESRGKNGER